MNELARIETLLGELDESVGDNVKAKSIIRSIFGELQPAMVVFSELHDAILALAIDGQQTQADYETLLAEHVDLSIAIDGWNNTDHPEIVALVAAIRDDALHNNPEVAAADLGLAARWLTKLMGKLGNLEAAADLAEMIANVDDGLAERLLDVIQTHEK